MISDQEFGIEKETTRLIIHPKKIQNTKWEYEFKWCVSFYSDIPACSDFMAHKNYCAAWLAKESIINVQLEN